MENSYLIKSTFTIESRSLFVLSGHPLDGKVTAGMIVCLPMDEDSFIEAEIESIEPVNTMDQSAPIGLAIRFDDPEDLEILRGLDIVGKKVEVKSAG